MKGKDVAIFFGIVLGIIHMAVIAGDVLQVVNDPSEQNKPGEVLKLAFDVSRYFPA